MKKIIRLTESDLTRIVKRVIKENSMRDDLIQMIKDEGWDNTAGLVGGDKNLAKLAFNNNPMDFLHMFDDLDVVQDEEEPNLSLFSYGPEHSLIVYDKKNNEVYIHHNDIWSVLVNNFGLNNSKSQKIIQEWLSKVYNLRRVKIDLFF